MTERRAARSQSSDSNSSNSSHSSNESHQPGRSEGHRVASAPDGLNDRVIPSIKILMLGDSGVGKSSLMGQFADNKFDVSLTATAGIDFKVRTWEVDGQRVSLKIWDTAGQERFKTITRQYYRGAMGVLIVFDCTDRASFDHIKYWLRNLESYANSHAQRLLVANKVDLNRKVSEEEGKRLADEFHMPYIESSAKTFKNVNEVYLSISRMVLLNWDYYATPSDRSATVTLTSSVNSQSKWAKCSC